MTYYGSYGIGPTLFEAVALVFVFWLIGSAISIAMIAATVWAVVRVLHVTGVM